MQLNKTVSSRLRLARSALGYTQKQIAEKVGAKLPSWKDNEAGKTIPGGKVLAGLSRLGVNVDWVLTGDGEMMGEVFDELIDPPFLPYSNNQMYADMIDADIYSDPDAAERRLEQMLALSKQVTKASKVVDTLCEDAAYKPCEKVRNVLYMFATIYSLPKDHIQLMIDACKRGQDE